MSSSVLVNVPKTKIQTEKVEGRRLTMIEAIKS